MKTYLTVCEKNGDFHFGDKIRAINEEDARALLDNTGRSHMRIYSHLTVDIDEEGNRVRYDLEELN